MKKEKNNVSITPNTVNPNSSTFNSTPAFSFGGVLQKYRNLNNLSQPDLADFMGVSRNTITNWETNKSRPEIEAIRSLCTHLGIPLNELFGLTADFAPSNYENALLRQFRQLNPSNQRIVAHLISSMLQEETDARDAALRDAFFILPLHSTPAAAGIGCLEVETPPTCFFVKKNGYNENADGIIRVSGHSMEPLYHDGDLVYIKHTSFANDGDDVVCFYSGGAVIKRMQNNKLYSLNKDYPFGKKSEQDNVKIMGKVIGIVRDGDRPTDEDRPALEELMAREIREFNAEYGVD